MRYAIQPTEKVLPGQSNIQLECRHPDTGKVIFRHVFSRVDGAASEARFDFPEDAEDRLVEHLERSGYNVTKMTASGEKKSSAAAEKAAEQGTPGSDDKA